MTVDGPTAWAGAGLPAMAAGVVRDPDRGVFVYPEGELPPNLWSLLADSAARHPERTALVGGDGSRLSYRQLREEAAAVAAAWSLGGIGRGDRVAILATNGIPFVVALFAAQRLGAVAVCLNTKLAPPEIAAQIADCGAAAVVYEAEFAAKLPPGLPRAWPAAALPQADPARLPPPAAGRDDPAVILYTSGTSGRPKGCVLTARNLGHSAVSYARCFGLGPEDRTLIAVPVFHVTGLGAQLLPLLRVGGTCALLPRFSATAALLWLEREAITHMLAVPTVYALLLQEPGHEAADLRRWRLGAYGGAAMPVAVARALRRWLPGLDLRNTYGLTEVASPATIMPPDPDLAHAGDVGLPVPVAELRLEPSPGGDDGVGELWVRGPMVTPGYWGRPEATAAAIVDGWLRTGDVAGIGRGGFVRILDRRQDMINRGGEKVYSLEVEDALAAHPDVMAAAVVGVPDAVYGETVAAFVVPRPGAAPTAEALQRHVAARLARYKVPQRIAFVAELPRNAAGKVEKGRLREEAARGRRPG